MAPGASAADTARSTDLGCLGDLAAAEAARADAHALHGAVHEGPHRLQVRFEPRAGRRRLVSIFEVTGLEGDVVTGNELWTIDSTRDRLTWTGIRPRCLEKIAARGVAYATPPAMEAAS